MQRVENSFMGGRPFSLPLRQRGSQINTSLTFFSAPHGAAGHTLHVQFSCLQLSHLWLVPVFSCVFKCDPTYSVPVVGVIRLHSWAKDWILYSHLILKLNYIFPNKYWSIFICISSWDTFRTMVIHIHIFLYPWVYSSVFLWFYLHHSGAKITFSCYTYFNHPLQRSSLIIWPVCSSVLRHTE